MNHEEAKLQADVVSVLSALGVYCMMIPNGEIGKLSPARFMRLVAQGFRRGASDLILFSDEATAFFLELKLPGKKQSKSQIDFQAMCIRRGWEYKVSETVQDAISAAEQWGLIPPQSVKKGPN